MNDRRLIDRLRPWNTLPQRGFAKLGRDIAALAGRPPPRPPPVVARTCPCGGAMALYSDGLAWEEYVGLLGDAEHWVIYCRACGYLTYDPTPAEADVAAFYDNDARADGATKYAYYDTAYGTDYMANRARFALARRAAVLQKDAAAGEGALRVFDLGCGDGAAVDAFVRLGHDAWGADAGALQIERGRERGNERIFHGDLLDHAERLSAEQPFDLLYMFHVLEHLTDPASALVRVRAAADENATLFVAVPNAWYLRIHLANLMGFGWHSFPSHLHFFSPTALCRLMESAGWRVLDIGAGSHNDPFPDDLFADLFRGARPEQFDFPGAVIQALEQNVMSCDFWVIACVDSAARFKQNQERLNRVRGRDMSHWLSRPRVDR